MKYNFKAWLNWRLWLSLPLLIVLAIVAFFVKGITELSYSTFKAFNKIDGRINDSQYVKRFFDWIEG